MLFLASLLSMAACTTIQSPQPELSAHLWPAHYDAIDYYSWVIGASSEQSDREKMRLEQLITRAGDEESLVQLAVLISAKTSDLRQQQLALDLLDQFEQYQSDDIKSDYRALAHLWRQALEPRLQSHELREQIKALTSIEQQLDRREQ